MREDGLTITDWQIWRKPLRTSIVGSTIGFGCVFGNNGRNRKRKWETFLNSECPTIWQCKRLTVGEVTGLWHTVAVNIALTKERLIHNGFYDLAIAYQSVHVNYWKRRIPNGTHGAVRGRRLITASYSIGNVVRLDEKWENPEVKKQNSHQLQILLIAPIKVSTSRWVKILSVRVMAPECSRMLL